MIRIKNQIVNGVIPDTVLIGSPFQRTPTGPFSLYRLPEGLPLYFTSIEVPGGSSYHAPITLEWTDEEPTYASQGVNTTR